jgi:hypothetical protein
MRSKDREKILARVAEDGINEFELTSRTRPATPSQESCFVEAWVTFDPSLMSDLWAEVPTTELENHADERKRWSFGSGKSYREEYAAKYKLPYPSVAEYLLTIDTALDHGCEAELQSLSIDLVCRAMPTALLRLDPFGYGCVGGKCRHMMMLHSLGGVAAWTDRLGDRFENIYPILVGPTTSCQGLATALGTRCSLTGFPQHPTCAVVTIPPDEVEGVRRDPAVKDWVVIRKISEVGATEEVADEIYQRSKRVVWNAPFVER